MSDRGVAERAIDAANRFDEEALEVLFSEEIVLDFSRSVGPAKGVYVGEEVRTFFNSYREAFESVVAQPIATYERGDLYAFEMHVRFRGRGSGLEVEARGARVYEVRDGKIVRLVQFQNMDDARAFVDAAQP